MPDLPIDALRLRNNRMPCRESNDSLRFEAFFGWSIEISLLLPPGLLPIFILPGLVACAGTFTIDCLVNISLSDVVSINRD